MYMLPARNFDFLNRVVELPEAIDGVCITGLPYVRVGERLKLCVAALFSGAVQPFVHVGLRGLKSAEENHQDGHLVTPLHAG